MWLSSTAVLALLWAVLGVVVTVPLSDEDLPVEHRLAAADDLPLILSPGFDITANSPAVSPDMFISYGPDGEYRFDMKGEGQWRSEAREADGTVRGRYWYITPEGEAVDISYNAGLQGYHARGDAIPGGAAPLYQEEVKEEEDETPHTPSDPLQEQEGPDLASAYGALLLAGVQETHPNGNGVITYTDDDTAAVITNVGDEESKQGDPLQEESSRPVAVYPVVSFANSPALFVGAPVLGNKPVTSAVVKV